jgi:putative peptidoglycan lipid II flippase
MSQMLKSSGAIALATLLSRILGLVREMAYAHLMGTGLVASAFTYAFSIPNLFRRLLGEGVLTAAFIPHFKEKQKLEGEAETWRVANAVLSALLVVATGLVLLMMAVATLLMWSGWFKLKTVLMLDLMRCMCPYLLLVCVAAFFMGMLNARGHFFVPAFGSVMLNVVMIGSVFFVAPMMGKTLERQVFGIALGVVLAGAAQAVYQIPLLRREGFRFRWITPWKDKSVRFVGRQMVPGILGVAAFQINVLISQGLGFWFADHIVSSFGYAVRLMELPQGLFGVSLATYLLPTLSGLATDKKYPEFRSTLQQGLGYVLTSNIMASVLLMVLAEPIIRLLFERGSFDAAATARVTKALVFLAPGLIAYSTVNILARAFYALGDTSTPTRISICCLILNLVLTGLFLGPLEQAGMGLANSMTAAMNSGLLLYALRRKLGRLDFSRLQGSIFALAGVALAGGAVAWLAFRAWENRFGHELFWLRMCAVFIPAGLAAIVYLGLIRCFHIGYGSEAIDQAMAKLRARWRR